MFPINVCVILFSVGVGSAILWFLTRPIEVADPPSDPPPDPEPEPAEQTPDTEHPTRRVRFIVETHIPTANESILSARRGDVWLRNPNGSWTEHEVLNRQVSDLHRNHYVEVIYGAVEPPELPPPIQVQFVRDYEEAVPTELVTGGRFRVSSGLVFTQHSGWWINGSTPYRCTYNMMNTLLLEGIVRFRRVRAVRDIGGIEGDPINLGTRFDQRIDGSWAQFQTPRGSIPLVCTAEMMASYIQNGLMAYEYLRDNEPPPDLSTETGQSRPDLPVGLGAALRFRPGFFQKFEIVRQFTLGGAGIILERGAEVEFDGTYLVIDSQIRGEFPALRGAVRMGWLTPISAEPIPEPKPVEPRSVLDRLLEEEREL